MDDYNRFAVMAAHLRAVGEELLTEFYGERCLHYVPSCPNCKLWRMLDELTANPFDTDSEIRAAEAGGSDG